MILPRFEVAYEFLRYHFLTSFLVFSLKIFWLNFLESFYVFYYSHDQFYDLNIFFLTFFLFLFLQQVYSLNHIYFFRRFNAYGTCIYSHFFLWTFFSFWNTFYKGFLIQFSLLDIISTSWKLFLLSSIHPLFLSITWHKNEIVKWYHIFLANSSNIVDWTWVLIYRFISFR